MCYLRIQGRKSKVHPRADTPVSHHAPLSRMNLPSSLLLANTIEGPIVAEPVIRTDMLQWHIESTGSFGSAACIDHSSSIEGGLMDEHMGDT